MRTVWVEPYTCPLCGADDPIVIREFNANELQPTITITGGDTVKTRKNPDYRLPDPGHFCTNNA